MTTVIARSAPTTEMPALASSPLGAYYFPYLLSAKDRFDQALLRYDAWYVVLVAVLLALGTVLLAGMAVWCVTKGHGKFTGHWKWVKWGFSVSMECQR